MNRPKHRMGHTLESLVAMLPADSPGLVISLKVPTMTH